MLTDRVKVNSSTTGTGPLTLSGVFSGYQAFPSGQVFYVAEDSSGNWEVGLGTVSGVTLSRNVLKSSNSNNLVNFPGATIIFIDLNADYLASMVQGINLMRRIW